MSNIGQPTLSYQSPSQGPKPLRTRSTLVMCALGVTLLAHLASGAVGYMQLSLLNRAAAGVAISAAEATANDVRYLGVHVVLIVMLIVSAVFLLTWMYRAYANCRALARGPLMYSPGGAVGWWFCPIINLFRPYQIMKEIFTVSTAAFGPRSAAAVGWWWGVWLMANIVSRVGTAISSSAEGEAGQRIDSFIAATWADMADIPFYLIAGLLLIWIIRQVDDAQERQRNISVMAPVPLPR